jgi:hypothetical protein
MINTTRPGTGSPDREPTHFSEAADDGWTRPDPCSRKAIQLCGIVLGNCSPHRHLGDEFIPRNLDPCGSVGAPLGVGSCTAETIAADMASSHGCAATEPRRGPVGPGQAVGAGSVRPGATNSFLSFRREDATTDILLHPVYNSVRE